MKTKNENFLIEEKRIDISYINNNKNSINHNQIEIERFSKSDPVPIEIMRVENIFIQNHSNSIKNITGEKSLHQAEENKEDIYVQENTPDMYMVHTLNTHSNYDQINKENIIFSNTYDYHNEEDGERPDLLISPVIALSPHELTRLSKSNHTQDAVENEIVIKEEFNHVNNEIDKIKENDCEFLENEKYFQIARNESVQNLIENLDIIFKRNYKMNRTYFYNIFNENLREKFLLIEDQFIQDIMPFENKIKLYNLKINNDIFIRNIKNNIVSKKYESYNISQCEKFIKYRKYKLKNHIFENLKDFSMKKINWLKLVRKELKQPIIWYI